VLLNLFQKSKNSSRISFILSSIGFFNALKSDLNFSNLSSCIPCLSKSRASHLILLISFSASSQYFLLSKQAEESVRISPVNLVTSIFTKQYISQLNLSFFALFRSLVNCNLAADIC